MTWKQIETSRAIRLWAGQIIVPAAAIVVGVLSIPGAKDNIKYGCQKFTSGIKNKFMFKKD